MERQLNDRSPGLRQLLPLYFACYVLWLAFSALTIWTMLQLRNALLALLTVVGPWVMGAIDKFGLFLFGIIALGWIMYMESYLRQGVDDGVFWSRAMRVAVIQLAVLGVAYGLQYLGLFL